MSLFRFKSISTRLIFYVTLSVLTLFTIIGGFLMHALFVMATVLFMTATSWHVDSKAAAVDKRLAEVQTTILANDVKVMNNLHSPKRLTALFDDILYNNSIFACGIALEPDSVSGERYLLYACRDGNGQTVVRQRPGDYAYERRDYFKETKHRMTSYWSDPYLDDTLRVTTFSQPLLDSDGQFIGVLCADVLLDSIATYVATDPGTSNSTILANIINKFFEGERSFILSRSGYFIITPDSTVTFNDTYETYALRHQSPEFKLMGNAIMKRDESKVNIHDEFKIDGDPYIISYSHITKVGWAVATLYPTAFVNTFLMVFCVVIVAILIIGVLLLVWIVNLIVRRVTRPLKLFVSATEAIAGGDFDTKLPEEKHYSEIKILRDSFDEMRLSLKDYVEQLKDTTAENERMEQDLNIASQIQVSMLPKTFPTLEEVPEVSLFAFLKPAREVGGDLYDFFIRSGHLHFVIGDVSGKGIPAAMIMAVTTSMFRALQRRDLSPERTMNALNNMLLERNSADMFVTLMIGDMTLATGELSICNAGHNPPILIEGGKQTFMKSHKNIPIGVFENYHYQSEHVTLAKGARMMYYTDGVSEATNAYDELFGEDRLIAAISRHEGKNVEPFINSIVDDLRTFTGDTPQSDDMTLLMVEYHGSVNIISREMSFSNATTEVTRASALVEEVCEKLSVDFALATSLQLAVEEAMVNVISYAYENGRANIDNKFTITSDGCSLTFTLSDSGAPFDPTAAEMPDTTLGVEERGVGGLGILLVRKIMDKVEYKRENDRNILIMTKNI